MSFIDAPPKWTHRAAIELRSMFAQSYPDTAMVRMVTDQAGFPTGAFPITQPTIETLWHSIINAMWTNGTLHQLITVGRGDPQMQRWWSRLDDMMGGTPATEPPLVVAPPAWKGVPEPARTHFQRLAYQRARYTPILVLREVAAIAGSVAYLDLRFGTYGFHGTGFLISPKHMLTNHHNVVHREFGAVSSVVADFDYEGIGGGSPLQVGAEVVASNEERDWAVLELARSVDRASVPLGSPFATGADDSLIIVQHPLGGPKQVAIDYLSVKHVDTRVVQYLADTQKGSSGSPVFNMKMHLIALHHSEVVLAAGDTGASKTMMYGNEGIRIERIMEDLSVAQVPFTAR